MQPVASSDLDYEEQGVSLSWWQRYLCDGEQSLRTWAKLNFVSQGIGIVALMLTLATEKHLCMADMVSAIDIATAAPTLLVLLWMLRDGRDGAKLPSAFVWWSLFVGLMWMLGVMIDAIDFISAPPRRTGSRLGTLVTDLFSLLTWLQLGYQLHVASARLPRHERHPTYVWLCDLVEHCTA